MTDGTAAAVRSNRVGAPGPWTDERIERLKELWNSALSCSQIADQLGNGISRNAIIGKVHRLGLAGRREDWVPREARPPRERRMGAQPSKPRALPPLKCEFIAPEPLPEPEPLPLNGGRVTVLHLSSKTCRWPIGHPTDSDFCFCGHTPRPLSRYCEYHSRIAYQPLRPSRAAALSRPEGFGQKWER